MTPSTEERNAPAVVAQGLKKKYKGDVVALDGLDLEVTAGMRHALVGPNGSGKTTTVKIMTTLTAADEGRALVSGIDVKVDPDRVRKTIGVVDQRSTVDLTATARENLSLQGRVYGLKGSELESRVSELLEQFGLTKDADRLVKGFSGGMARRLDVALGLVHRPRVLFLDEPSTGLDPEARHALWEEIGRLVGGQGMTILFTTHYLEEAERYGELVSIIDSGKVIATGTPDELKSGLRGDALFVELAAAPDIADVNRALSGVEGVSDVVLEDSRLRARAEVGARAVPRVLSELDGAGIQVDSVTVSRPSLDDAYLLYTGRRFAEVDRAGEEAAAAAAAGGRRARKEGGEAG